MADIDIKSCISEQEQPAIIRPFAHFWNHMIGCEQAKYGVTVSKAEDPAGNNFRETHQLQESAPMAATFQSDSRTPIAEIKMPDDWKSSRTERGGIGQRALDEYTPPDKPGISIFIFQEGLPLKEKAAQSLGEVLAKGNHQLMPNEIIAIRDAIGYSNAGDNQYTDKNYRPTFNLTAAGVQTVNDSQVIMVEGRYNNGGKMFKGIFAPFKDEQGQTRVQQVFMEGAPEQFPRYLGTYNSVVNSISWKPEMAPEFGISGRTSPPPHNTGMLRD